MRKLSMLLVPAALAGVMTAAVPAMAAMHAAPTSKAAKPAKTVVHKEVRVSKKAKKAG